MPWSKAIDGGSRGPPIKLTPGTSFPQGSQANPNGLATSERSTIARYFATVSEHSDYDVIAAQLAAWIIDV